MRVISEALSRSPVVTDVMMGMCHVMAAPAESAETLTKAARAILHVQVLMDGHWLSTCVAVPVAQRTIFVVPHPHVRL